MTERVDDTTLGQMVEHAREAHKADVYYEVAPNEFLAIVTELAEHRARELSGGWVAVTERMPDWYVGCLVIGRGDSEPIVGAVRSDGRFWSEDIHGALLAPKDVTHWMPLPPAPEVST